MFLFFASLSEQSGDSFTFVIIQQRGGDFNEYARRLVLHELTDEWENKGLLTM